MKREVAMSQGNVSQYIEFSRDEWRTLRAATPLTLTQDEIVALQGINEQVSLAEVEDILLPLARLLHLNVAATQGLHRATDTFLGRRDTHSPYIIGIAGSVAVGKSTTARILQALLARWPHHPTVDLVTTDGFLYPNHLLESRGLMARKGFPESYDVRRLVQALAAIKSGAPKVPIPVYSHLVYDIVPDDEQVIQAPDIVLVEGLNVLQAIGSAAGSADGERGRAPRMFVSDFFDFSIYVDAAESDIEEWYISRFLALRETVFTDASSYFHRYIHLTQEEAIATATRIWHEINRPNLRENILPTRERARLILAKGRHHTVRRVKLRKM